MFLFTTRKKRLDVHQLLRRAMDTTSPNLLPEEEEEKRWEDRSNRTIPILLAPWVGGEPKAAEHTIAVTKNLSSQGIALVLPQPFRAEQVVLCFWLESMPEFVLGEIRQNSPLGGGFWQLGVELTERINPVECGAIEPLISLATRLKVRS